ncbi:MAG TPA: hypothetical protein VGN64_16880 [Dyadobacter sp.]|jgi:hypothetical protein|nr:hypothetical protein [Dyadobacter sp.]
MGTLLVFLVVFLPIGWFLWRMLRYTRDTIGTNSPLKVQRIYHTTFQSIFIRIDYILVVICAFMGGVFIYAALFSTFSGLDPITGRTILFVMSSIVLSLAAVILVVDLNHWPYTRGVVITTFPDEHELDVQLPDATFRIKKGDIRKISIYHNNARLQLGFAQYHLQNGDSFLLSFRTEGLEVIQEYFKGIPVEEFVYHIPLISKHQSVTRHEHKDQVKENRYGWLTFFIQFLVGVCLVTITCMMYKDAKWQDDMSMHAPVVCMKIKYGIRGAGTVKYPDQVYADYMGKTYHFDMGRKYYRSLTGVDSIAVYFDQTTGRAFLPTSGQVRHYTGLYLLIAGVGLLFIGVSSRELIKIAGKRHPETSGSS